MYVFGIVVTTSDATPVGRASDALRAQLPGMFPEFAFEFVGPEELESELAPHELLFRVLGAEVHRESDGETISEEGPTRWPRPSRLPSTRSSPPPRQRASTNQHPAARPLSTNLRAPQANLRKGREGPQ